MSPAMSVSPSPRVLHSLNNDGSYNNIACSTTNSAFIPQKSESLY